VYKRGIRDEFERLLLPHLDAAFTLARWLLRDAHDAEDAVQESYLKAYQAFAHYQGGSSAAWLLQIVRNTSISMLRRRKARGNVIVLKELLNADDPVLGAALEDVGPGPERELLARAEQKAVQRALAGLSEIFREVIVLRELEDMSYQEIANITQLPIGTVMSRLSRARRALREALKEDGEGDERGKL
jgi:RNA polymerase sigma-70 factor (ECF subfamily)